MVNIDQVKRGIAAYADTEIMSKIPGGGLKKIGIGTMLTLFINNLDKTLDSSAGAPMLGMLGIKNADGSVNIDAIAEAMKKNIDDSGAKINLAFWGIPIGDMTFHRSDVDALRTYILNA